MHDEGGRKVALYLTSRADTDIGEYLNQYVVLLHVGEAGEVDKVLEFVDSAYSVGFLGRLMAVHEGEGGKKGVGG